MIGAMSLLKVGFRWRSVSLVLAPAHADAATASTIAAAGPRWFMARRNHDTRNSVVTWPRADAAAVGRAGERTARASVVDCWPRDSGHHRATSVGAPVRGARVP